MPRPNYFTSQDFSFMVCGGLAGMNVQQWGTRMKDPILFNCLIKSH